MTINRLPNALDFYIKRIEKMFKHKKEENKKNEAVSIVSGSNNSIVTGTKLEGTINANSDIRIDGELVGKLFCKGRVIIGPSGVVDGELDCQNAIIEGKFTGNLKVSELLTLKENATISGDIKTDNINIQTGASFNGNCSMGGQSIKSSQKSNGALAIS